MSYTSATFFIDLESGSDAARTALTTVTVSNPSGTITRANKTAHGLTTGAVVDLTLFSAWLNAAWKITVFDADNFDLDGAVWQATADNNGTVTPRGGSSKADAWLTPTSGATAARTAAGDTIRIKASTDETLVGNATWTQYSKTVTLAGAVTANITDCETAWTASANVTSTADTAVFKENTKSAKHVIASAFTTGLVSFFATGTLDLSTYQQVSFWVRATIAIPASTLSLRLCSDVAGVTTVHTIAIPANPGASTFMPVTVDLGSNMDASIKSIALYADLDPGTMTVYLDNIIACKASSSADALTLTSLLGKIWNLCWVASTTYAANDIRKPTQPNRNGYRYKVTAGGGGAAGSSEPTWPQEIGVTVTDGALTWTCEGLEDTWYPIQSINGTTIKLDNDTNCLGNAGRGYGGATETVSSYRRVPLNSTVPSASNTKIYTFQKSGTQGSEIVYTGGWNRTDMTTQTGETWVSCGNGLGVVFYTNSLTSISMYNLNTTRATQGSSIASQCFIRMYNCHHVGLTAGLLFSFFTTSGLFDAQGIAGHNAGSFGLSANNTSYSTYRVTSGSFCNNLDSGWASFGSAYPSPMYGANIRAVNNTNYGVSQVSGAPVIVSNLVTANNSVAGVNTGLAYDARFNNALLGEGTPFAVPGTDTDQYIYSQKHAQTAGNHLITTDGGTIISATDQRHTASGISWKFRPTSTNRSSTYPLRLSIAKVAVTANNLVTMSVWTYRDNTNIQGQLFVAGAQLAGVPVDVTVSCAPSINTWTQSSNLTFTPTEDGVVEVLFRVWDGTGTTNNMWVDDFTVTQA